MRTRSPLFATAGILTLGFGLGANSATAQECATYDVETLAAIADDISNPLSGFAANCLAQLVAPAQGLETETNEPEGGGNYGAG